MTWDQKELAGYLVDVDTGERLEFQYNPSEITDEKGTDYAATKIPGMSHPRYQYVAGEARRIGLRIGLFKGPVKQQVHWLRSLLYLGDLANRYGVAIILTHHFNKSGTGARGSSVYQGWGETDLSISKVDNAPDVVKVDALLRCAFPKGFPALWRKPDEHTAWFERMPEGWSPEKPGRKAKVTPQLAVMVLRDSGRTLRYKEYLQILMDTAECGKSAASEAIAKAVSERAVLKGAGLYALPQHPRSPNPEIQDGQSGYADSEAGS